MTNQTTDWVIALNSNIWAISTLQPVTLQIIDLTKTYYIKAKHPLDIITLAGSCEAFLETVRLPVRNQLSKEVDSRQLVIDT